jgi:hypothetical protein
LQASGGRVRPPEACSFKEYSWIERTSPDLMKKVIVSP